MPTNNPWIVAAAAQLLRGLQLDWNQQPSSAAACIPHRCIQIAHAAARGGPENYSCSLRAFLRLRLRASASFTRFFSPGFK